MDRFLLHVFQCEVKMQCEFVLLASDQLGGESLERDWMALQTIAVSAANLSKLFWGSGGKRNEERKALRESLQIAEDSCLQSPDLRNDFEHFDERIEERIIRDDKRIFVGRNIVSGMDGDGFGHYDPRTGVLSFWDHSINVREIVAEVRRIHPLVMTETSKPFWVKQGTWRLG